MDGAVGGPEGLSEELVEGFRGNVDGGSGEGRGCGGGIFGVEKDGFVTGGVVESDGRRT